MKEIRRLANLTYADLRRDQGPGQRPQAADPSLAQEPARALSRAGRRRPCARRSLWPAHRRKARRQPADRKRASESPHAGWVVAFQTGQAVDLLPARRRADRGDEKSDSIG